MAADAPPAGGLNILHVLRAPVGGLFRHVLDLVRGQYARGNRLGLVADSLTGGTQAEENFAQLAPHLALGLTRVPMSRQFGLRDLAARARTLHDARSKPWPTSYTVTAPKAAPMPDWSP